MPGEQELARRFIEFTITLKRMFRHVALQTDQHLTEERYRSLLYLLKMEEAGLSELSERLSISASSLCIMLGKLEEEGLVERHRSKEDRRQVRYSCTPKGRERLLAAQTSLLNLLTDRFYNISSEKRDQLMKAFDEIESIFSMIAIDPFEK
ncbi:MarR family winged helix-turn-helix transcriptional regulator [Gracilinema caldarium]|uniref:Regulatory protein MarR n=1 Tax=Gracilinema caldarium (strain ATCC 51460 / DSM 7334 / H1) TaxID=744872 RepID=F8EXE5_GRAC1|nr:MarR family transcriptional regulator [Gracilinema caldarium]AEJ19172.1 regulatory protein MarR [Gracilinema caldarium DSM 7334]